MDFLKRNSGKIALIAIIAFLALPFIYGNEEEEDFSPFAVRSGMSYQANPISKLANKIASFYGFSKPASKEIVASSGGINSIKDKVSFSKENPLGKLGKINSQKDTLLASSKNFKNFDVDSLDSNTSNTQMANSRNNFSDGVNSNSYTNASNPVKGYVTVNGQRYDVVEDAKGEKYVVTPKGHIPYRDLTRRVVSEQEFANAKKNLAGASDMEILAALQQEKSKQAYSTQANGAYQTTSTSYKNAMASNMGGTNYARVSVEDKGFDDDVLSNAYADLKNINLKIEPSSSSEGRSSYGSAALRDSYGNAAEELENVDESINITPQDIAGKVKAETQQNLAAQDKKASLQQEKEGVAVGIKEEERIRGESLSPVIIPVKITENGVYEEAANENTGMFFVPVKEGSTSPYAVWGDISSINFADGEEKFGIIIPIGIDRSDNLYTKHRDEKVQKSVQDINNYVSEIEDIAFALDKKIYIDTSTMDEFSKSILLERKSLSNYITDKYDEASVLLSGPVCTPVSFQQFVNEFKKQQTELLGGKEGHPTI